MAAWVYTFCLYISFTTESEWIKLIQITILFKLQRYILSVYLHKKIKSVYLLSLINA